MKWLVFGLGLLLVLAVLGFFTLGPGIAEQRMNKVDAVHFPVGSAAKKLHKTLLVADLHADSLLWNRNLLAHGKRGHVDLPRLQAGNVALQVFTTVTKSPAGLNNVSNAAKARDNITLLAVAQLWPRSTWRSLSARAIHQARRLKGFVDDSDQQLVLVQTKLDLSQLLARRRNGEPVVGALLGTEGSHALDGNLDNVQRLFDAGFRMMSLQHFFDNALGGSLHGIDKGGLSEFGRQVVREIERLGIMLDVSHSSEKVVRETLAITKRPLIVSHTGIRGHCDTPRNISDELMKRIADGGGLVGTGYWQHAACDITPVGIAKSIIAAVELLGDDHVALGSDFDGAVTTGFDAAEMAKLTQALLELGTSEQTIRKVMGENQLRFFATYLPD
ncbi:MAG: membrane dipeptidase [Pseudomonadota bacterium]